MNELAGYLTSIAGTEAGHRLALVLALTAAALHATFGALQKGRHDPWLARGAMDASYALILAPVVAFVVPWPEPHLWPILAVAVVIHIAYKVLQGYAFVNGAFTVVYPVVRGTGPLFAVIGAGVLFGERFSALQWTGLAVLLAGIFGLAVYNLIYIKVDRDRLVPALLFALSTGLFVALYTTFDAYGIRATENPFTFLAWLLFLDGLTFPVVALVRWRRMAAPPALGPLALRGLFGGIVAIGSYGSVMMATRLDQVGEAAVLRETSILFAAAIGRFVLGDPLGPRRWALMALIAAGAVLVEAGG